MFHKKKTIIYFLILILLFNFSGCGRSNNVSDDRQINLYIGVKDGKALDMIKYAIDEYKKANPKVELNINNSIGEKIDGDINDNSKMDVVFISRTDMMNLARKSALSDMRNLYRENNLNDRYYSVSKAYGRFNDKYYGIALFPYTIEILCNEEAFNKLNLKMPNSMSEFLNTLKSLNSLQKKVPVVLNEDMDINTTLFSIVSNNLVSMRKLEGIYDSGTSAYKSLEGMQEGFYRLNDMVKKGYIDKNTFEIGNESTLQKFNGNDIPVIITSSCYIEDMKNTGIKCLKYDTSTANNIKAPVMADVIMSTPVNSKNMDEMSDFVKFILSDDIQKKLYDKGFITGNKKANVPKGDLSKSIISHLKNSTEDNMAVIYNMPKNFKYNISLKIDSIFSGKYTGNEWNEVIEESY